MSDKQQTAVEWLEKRYYFTKGQLIDIDFEQAKAMEKEQITDAVKHGNSFEQGDLRCELYFEKTFKND